MQGSGGGNMPWDTGRLSIPGTSMGINAHNIPILRSMFPNPYEQFKQQQMQNAAAGYSMYRPEAAQAQMNMMNAQSANLQPMNNALAAMYGTGATQGFAAQNPFGPEAFTRNSAVGTNPYMPGEGPGFGGMPAPAPAGSPGTYPNGREPQNRTPPEGWHGGGQIPPQAGQYDLSEDWRLGRTSDAGQKNRDMANSTGGQYGASARINPFGTG